MTNGLKPIGHFFWNFKSVYDVNSNVIPVVFSNTNTV